MGDIPKNVTDAESFMTGLDLEGSTLNPLESELWFTASTKKAIKESPDGGFEIVATDVDSLTRKELALIITKLRPDGQLIFGRRIDGQIWTVAELMAYLQGEPSDFAAVRGRQQPTEKPTKKQPSKKLKAVLKIDKASGNVIERYKSVRAAAADNALNSHQIIRLLRDGIEISKHTALSREMWKAIEYDWRYEDTA